MNIGNAILQCRRRLGLTQTEVAEKAGVSVSYLSLLERGHRQDPSLSTIEGIAGAMRIPVNILLFMAAEPRELGGMSPELVDTLTDAARRLMSEAQ